MPPVTLRQRALIFAVTVLGSLPVAWAVNYLWMDRDWRAAWPYWLLGAVPTALLWQLVFWGMERRR